MLIVSSLKCYSLILDEQNEMKIKFSHNYHLVLIVSTYIKSKLKFYVVFKIKYTQFSI